MNPLTQTIADKYAEKVFPVPGPTNPWGDINADKRTALAAIIATAIEEGRKQGELKDDGPPIDQTQRLTPPDGEAAAKDRATQAEQKLAEVGVERDNFKRVIEEHAKGNVTFHGIIGPHPAERENAALRAQLQTANEELARVRETLHPKLRESQERVRALSSGLTAAKGALETLRKRESVLVDAMAEVKATSDGKSTQPIASIVSGCITELALLAKPDGASANKE
jgi:hypothetical protein